VCDESKHFALSTLMLILTLKLPPFLYWIDQFDLLDLSLGKMTPLTNLTCFTYKGQKSAICKHQARFLSAILDCIISQSFSFFSLFLCSKHTFYFIPPFKPLDSHQKFLLFWKLHLRLFWRKKVLEAFRKTM